MNDRENILVVDDMASVRRLLSRRLSAEGYPCLEAGSASQAIEILKNCPSALVLLDIKMPGQSGVELLPEIKYRYPDTAVIMATSVNDTGTIIECMKKGADDYILKPFNLDHVAQCVHRTLEKRELQIRLRHYQERLEKEVVRQTKEIRRLFLGAIESLVSALEAKDRYTAGHSRRVTLIAIAIGEEIGLGPEEMENLRWGSLLHDVGKIAVDQLIQNKPARLTPAEYEQIMIHGHVGAGIVRPVVNNEVVRIVEHHHDRYDGSGLNQTVKGEEIPFGARILAVADAFDAMTSDRPYRAAMSVEEALAELRRCRGKQFDPVILDAFLKIIAAGKIAWPEKPGDPTITPSYHPNQG